jgi:transposase
MAGRRLMTLDVRELLRRLRAGESHRRIARDLGVARKTVRRYRDLAKEEGFLDGPLLPVEELDRRLDERMPESSLPRQVFKAAPYRGVIEDLRRRGVEVAALHQRLKDDHGFTGSYSALLRYVHHLEECSPTGFVRLEVAPGEEAQVDFGSAGKMVDPRTGEIRKAWVFVMTLSFSRHQYSTFVFDQKVPTWLRCHREAFEYFGSVPRKLVIDYVTRHIIDDGDLRDPAKVLEGMDVAVDPAWKLLGLEGFGIGVAAGPEHGDE